MNYNWIYFLSGIIISIIIIKILLPKPKEIKMLPTIQNCDDITYVDEEGKYYKYDLMSFHLE